MLSAWQKIQYKIIRSSWSMVKNNKVRSYIRTFILKYRPVLPRELMVNAGDHIVQVGIPSRNSLSRLLLSIGKNGSIVIIEPDERNQEMILEIQRELDFNNLILVKKAAWHKNEKLTFLVATSTGDGRLLDEQVVHDNDLREEKERGGYSKVNVDADSIDNILNELNVDKINFIEIAINGAEVHALRGLSERLSTSVERLYVKAHARDASTNEPISKEIIELLKSSGFDIRRTLPSKSVHEEWGQREGDVYAWKIL